MIGLLDHEKPCTLIRPIVEHIDPGRLDVKNKSQRTIIKGEFQALLSDIPAEDGDEPKFMGVAFESVALDAWFGSPTFARDFNRETRTPTLDIKPSETETFAAGGLGQVTITRAARLDSKLRSSSLRSATIFRVDFEAAKSINEVMSLAFSLERLFGFLVGFRGPYPAFTTWTANKIKAGDIEWNYDGTLQLGSVDWTEGEPPHPLSCVHLKGIAGGELPSILERYLANEGNIIDRIHAVEFSRFFSRNINDRFAVSMPVIDSYVQGRYKTGDETSYIDAQSEFFAWIESSTSEPVREFPKKHISIKNSKAPGLKTLLLRAIEHVNGKGFCFDPELATRIQDRRGKLFHAAPQMAKDEVLKFYIEVRAIAGLLLLHTIEDLGINIEYLAHRYHALGDLQPFMQPPKRDRKPADPSEVGPEHRGAREL
ncbi:hypothetical protein GGQ76_003682 [Aureimonas jatrophae]|nr:hypothetical protein [Aureimonas jatrophae]MBB3952368.1 hypothetical protein [Aureimonas jatrophae]